MQEELCEDLKIIRVRKAEARHLVRAPQSNASVPLAMSVCTDLLSYELHIKLFLETA